MWRARSVLAGVVCVALVSLSGAHAASFGGVSAGSLLSIDASASISTPPVLGCDNFSFAAATGAALNNRPLQLPAACSSRTWTVNQGTWTISGGQLAASGATSRATYAMGLSDVSTETTVLNADSNGRTAGLTIDDLGATQTYLLAVVSNGNSVAIRIVVSGVSTTLVSTGVVIPATTRLRLTRNGSLVYLSLDGVLQVSTGLTAAQQTSLSGGRVGLYWSAGTQIRFTDQLVTQPSVP